MKKGLTYIRSVYSQLTKAEKKVANIVLEDKEKVIYYTLTDLAERANVGETTVLRFCRQIGYNGYQKFKLDLAQSLVNNTFEKEEEPNRQTIVERVTKQNVEFLSECDQVVTQEQVERVSDMFINASKIALFGVGTSGFTANIAMYRFIRIGLPTECYTDSHLISLNALRLGPDDVACFFTISGSTVDIVEAAKMVKKTGAKIVCITGHIKSPVTKNADEILISPTRVLPTEGSDLSSIMSQLNVIDIFFTQMKLMLGDEAEEMMLKTASAASGKLI